MRISPILFCVPVLATLIGCTSAGGIKGAKWPWKDGAIPCGETCEKEHALRAFIESSKYCRDVQNYYESGGFYATSSRLVVGTLGALAGSVFAPLAEGTAAKAWAGLSGATNALQSQMDEAFSSAVAVRRRSAIAQIADEGFKRYFKEGNSNTDKVLIAIDTARACSMGSAVADRATLRALTDFSDDNGSNDGGSNDKKNTPHDPPAVTEDKAQSGAN